MSASNPGDTNLYSATLNGVDIRRMMKNVSVFENLKTPYTVVQMLVYDDQDIIGNMDFSGNASFSISFGQAPDQDPYNGTWIISTIQQGQVSENFRVKCYTCQGYSQHMFSPSRNQKAYRDVPMTDIVADVLKEVSPAKGLLNRAPSKNMAGNTNMPLLRSGQQTWQMIRTAMLGSASSVDPSSAYVLFENRFNMVLDTLEHLLNAPLYSGTEYWQRHLGTDFFLDSAKQQSTLISYRTEKMMDTTSMIQAQSQGTRTFDIFSQGFQDLPKIASAAAGLFFGGGAGKQGAFNSIPQNSMRPPTYTSQTADKRRTMASRFDAQSLTIHVPLNPAITIGSEVMLHLWGALGDLQDMGNTQDGSIIITENRHTVDFMRPRMSGTTTAKGIQKGLIG